MNIYSVLGLTLAIFLLAITPGPGVLATVSKSLTSGFRHSIPLVAGIVLGDLIFLLLAIFGLAAVAESFSSVFTTIKYLGAAYLIWLGISLWRMRPEKIASIKVHYRPGKHSFFVGLSITLGNPKAILFYLAFLPTFINLDLLTGSDIVIVAMLIALVVGSVLLFYAHAAARLASLFTSNKSRTRINRVAGSVMIGTGTALLTRA